MLWRLMTFFLSFSDSVSMNLGECLLTRFETNYSLMARVLYQTQYSRNAKKKYLKDFEEYDSDSDVRKNKIQIKIK